jgi:ribulose-phosphate 3-epimerase
MSIVCPTILAKDEVDYKNQMAKVASFAKRIQVDLEDGKFAPGLCIPLNKIWWSDGMVADIHVMYESPQDYLEQLIDLRPSMVIVHAESTCDIPKFAAILAEYKIFTGLAILQKTQIEDVKHLFPHVQHLLIFSGDLGHFGGQADFSLISKIGQAKNFGRHLEIGWDGGINADNATKLAEAGVDVLNVGGAIQNADNPQKAYAKIEALASDYKK